MNIFDLQRDLQKEKLSLEELLTEVKASLVTINENLEAVDRVAKMFGGKATSPEHNQEFMAKLRSLLSQKFSQREVDELIEIIEQDDVRRLNGKLNKNPASYTHQVLALCYQMRIVNGNIQDHMKDAIKRLREAGHISVEQSKWFVSQGF
jgi:hypothetical protein